MMCKFFSCCVLPNGDVKWHWMLDSHSDIAAHFDLRDSDPGIAHGRDPKFAKVEFTPPTDGRDVADLDNWTWRVDEEVRPSWLTEAIEDRAKATVRRIIQSRIIRDTRTKWILEDFWIVVGSASVCCRGASRVWAYDSSTVTAYDSSTVRACGSSTVRACDSSKVTDYRKAVR